MSLINKRKGPITNKEIIKDGKKLIEKNNFFKDFVELMECKTFNKFLGKYMFNSLEIKNSLIYIKLYETYKKF